MMTGNGSSTARARHWMARLLLLAGGTLLGLSLAEVVLSATGQPRFHRARRSAASAEWPAAVVGGRPLYVNAPGGMRLVYDDDPRGYFGPLHEVDHQTNSLGFRGPEFRKEKPGDTLRLVFLGDSFTFGDGVHDSDTYAEVTSALLRADLSDSALMVESLNLGVGGYNAIDSARMLRFIGLSYAPDVVVLGYVLNDAEPSLLEVDPASGRIVWGESAANAPELAANPLPPDTWPYRLRTARLLWKYFSDRESSRRTVAFYQSLYEDSAVAWDENRRALHEIIELSESKRIPCIVLLFPILHELNDDYPFAGIHAKVAHEVEKAGGTLIDLFPRLKGRKASELWVHPADQHPNEEVHAIAAEELAAAIASLAAVQRRVSERRAGG